MIPTDDERVPILREFGLSEYAARAYLALLQLGPTEARDVSRLAKVPIAKVYSTLDQLAQRGFLIAIPETPRRFAPVPIGQVLQRIASELEARARETKARASKLDRLFPMDVKEHASDRGTTTILRGRRVANEKMHQLAARSNDVLTLASDRLAARAERTLGGEPQERVLKFASDDPSLVMAYPAGWTMRELPNRRHAPNPVTIRVYGDDAAILVHHVPDDSRSLEGQDVSVLIEEKALVRALRDLLEEAWSATRGEVVLARRATPTGASDASGHGESA